MLKRVEDTLEHVPSIRKHAWGIYEHVRMRLVQAQVVLSSRANTSHAVRDLSESVESLVGLNL